MFHDARVLIRYRLKAAKNRWSAGALIKPMIAIVCLLGAVAAIGWLAAPTLMTIPRATSLPGVQDKTLVPGWRALELAFWLTTLFASVSSFRVMELMYRREDVSILSSLPLTSNAIFVDRVIASVMEGIGFSIPLVVFFAPMLARDGGALPFALASSLAVAGLLATAATSLAVMQWAGAQFGDPRQSSGAGDIYGGAGGAFIYGPGASLAVAIVTILLLQLTFGEVLKSGEWTRAFRVGLMIAGGIAGVSLVLALKYFRAYRQVAAYFREAETIGFEIDIDYQNSEMSKALRGERLLPDRARLVFRRNVLQLSRRHVLVRNLYGLAAIASLLAFMLMPVEVLSAWVVVMVSVGVFALSNPWARLRSAELGAGQTLILPLDERDEALGESAAVLREMIPVIAFIAASFVAVMSYRGGEVSTVLPIGIAAFLLPLSLAGVMAGVRRVPALTRWIPGVFLLLVFGLSVLHDYAIFAALIGLTGFAIAVSNTNTTPFHARKA